MASTMELNKIAGAVLVAGLVAMATGKVAEILVHPEMPAEKGYKVEVAEAETPAAGKPEETQLAAVGPLLANANPAEGEKLFKRCAACHTATKGGPNRVGPNLWNVVGAQPASHDGFAYSDAMKALGKPWDYETLNAFIANPKGVVPGTKMNFAGLKKVEDRADVIAYLRAQADSPKPLQ